MSTHPDVMAFAYLSVPARDMDDPWGDPGVRGLADGLVRFAVERGYAVIGTFADVRGRSENGIYHLLAALREHGVTVVITPGLDHFEHAGCLRGATVETASRYLRARILTCTDELSRPR